MIEENLNSVASAYYYDFANSTNSTWWQRRATLVRILGSIWRSSVCLVPHASSPGSPAQEWTSVSWIIWLLCTLGFCWTPPRGHWQAWGTMRKGSLRPWLLLGRGHFGSLFSVPRCTVSICRPRPRPLGYSCSFCAVIIPCLPSSQGLATAPCCCCLRVIAFFLVDF